MNFFLNFWPIFLPELHSENKGAYRKLGSKILYGIGWNLMKEKQWLYLHFNLKFLIVFPSSRQNKREPD